MKTGATHNPTLLRRGVTLALVVCVTLFSACSSDKGGMGSQDPGQAPTEAQVSPPSRAVQPVRPPMAAQRPPQANQAPSSSQAQGERTLAEQQRMTLLDHFLEIAQAKIQSGELEDAERSVLQAFDISPTNQRAVELLQQIRSQRGQDFASTASLTQYIANKRRLVRQQQQVLVNDALAQADRARAGGDWRTVQRILSQAALRVDINTYNTDFGPSADRVREGLAEAERRVATLEDTERERILEASYAEVQAQRERARAREQEQVRNLLIEAHESFANEDFDSAQRLARSALNIDPSATRASDLIRSARNAVSRVWRQRHLERRKEGYVTWLEAVRERQIPYTDLVQLPSVAEWDRITDLRQRVTAGTDAANESDAVKAMRAKLENDTLQLPRLEGEERLFRDVIQLIRARSNINVVLDPEVAEESADTPVEISFGAIPLGTGLDLVLDQFELGRVFRNGVLFITTKEKALTLRKPGLEIHEVRDLTIKLSNFRAPKLSVRPGESSGEDTLRDILGEEGDPNEGLEIDALAETVRANVFPEVWEVDGFSLEPGSGSLITVATPEVQKAVRDFLDDMRRFMRLSVHVEARFISVQKGFLSDIGFDWRGAGGRNSGEVVVLDDVRVGGENNAGLGLGNGGPGPTVESLAPVAGLFYGTGGNGDIRSRTENIIGRQLGSQLTNRGGASVAFSILDDAQIQGIFRAVEKNLDTSVVNAPRLTVFNTMRSSLTLVNQVSYVKDYAVAVAQTAFIADPVIDIIQDGVTLEVKPTVGHNRQYVTLEIKPTVATLLRPIRTFESSLSGLTTPVVIELPEVRFSEAATTVTVPDQGYVLIGGLNHTVTADQRSEVPILGDLPILSFFFSRKARTDEIRDLIIVIHVEIIDLSDIESDLGG